MTILLTLVSLLAVELQAPAPAPVGEPILPAMLRTATVGAGTSQGSSADTLRIEVGSDRVDGRVFPPHRARNTVYIGDSTEPAVSWTNELTVGDSAGRQVMRWVTRGGPAGDGEGTEWELRQTYDARTLAPLAWERTAGNGAFVRLRMDGTRVHGVRRAPGASAHDTIDVTLDRLGFIASASDLVPMAVGLRAGVVIIAPVWAPGMAAAEERVFTVLGEQAVTVEDAEVVAWKVEERVLSSGDLVANWYLTEASPYMVYAEVMQADGLVRRITGVALD